MSTRSRLLFSLLLFLALFSLKYKSAGALNGEAGREIIKVALKSRVLVIGEKITLGDLGAVITDSEELRQDLASIVIALSPPPGESTEIRLISIKRSIRRAGYPEIVRHVVGPRVIKVRTAEIEIHKAILREEWG